MFVSAPRESKTAAGPVLELAHQQVLVHRGKPQTAVVGVASSARTFGQTGAQLRGDVLRQERTHLDKSGALLRVELEAHAPEQ